MLKPVSLLWGCPGHIGRMTQCAENRAEQAQPSSGHSHRLRGTVELVDEGPLHGATLGCIGLLLLPNVQLWSGITPPARTYDAKSDDIWASSLRIRHHGNVMEQNITTTPRFGVVRGSLLRRRPEHFPLSIGRGVPNRT